MRPGLSDRLGRLKKSQGMIKPAPSAPRPTAESAAPAGEAPAGWTALDRDVWRREVRSPGIPRDLRRSGYLVPDGSPAEDWLFFDTETTGLSGGAGNTAFLIGLGRQEGEEFVTIQYFLRDYPGEPVLLNRLKEEFDRAKLFISYNGRTFDSHLLQTRFLMNRIHYRFGPQLDLLYPVRQLYRRTLPDCRLGTTEDRLLGMPRQGDIPGSEIPDMWFRFLKEGEADLLDQVFEHNRLDIIRMADLLIHLETLLVCPGDESLCRDPFALGRFLTERDDPRGPQFLEEALAGGDRRAETYLSVMWKRQGEWEKATALWRSIMKERPGYFAGVELAKYLEHRRKAPREALAVVDRLLRELPLRDPVKRAELAHRRRRLTGKLEKQKQKHQTRS